MLCISSNPKFNGKCLNRLGWSLISLAAILSPDLARAENNQKIDLIATGIENFDPSQAAPVPEPEPLPTPPPPPKPPATNSAPSAFITPFGVLDSVDSEFSSTSDTTGKNNFATDIHLNFGKKPGEKFQIQTGRYTYGQTGTATVNNIPVKILWETQYGALKLKPSLGIDLLDTIPSTPSVEIKAEYPLGNSFTLSTNLQQGLYKFNGSTINNRISAWRYGPGILWKLDNDTTVLANLTIGNYSDRNYENQLFARIERKFGQFSIAGNLFNWSYANNPNNGYFAPAEFLVYASEFGWEGHIFDLLKCKAVIPIGIQQVNGVSSAANGYNFRCNAKLSESIGLGFGYNYNNLKNRNDDNNISTSEGWTGGLKVEF